jgi:hypothetical protein
LVLLRFLERIQERDLARTRRWIVDEERREAEHRRSIEARPPVPDWLIEQSIVHHPAGGRSAARLPRATRGTP